MQQSNFPTAHAIPMQVSLRVKKLAVQLAGTYNPMVYRPYETRFNADIADSLVSRIESQGQSGTTTAALMAGLANQIIMPSQQPIGNVPIVNGWDTPRGRFMMVVEMKTSSGAEFEYHIQGYTNHYDVSLSGLIDPNMEFYVNSYAKLSKSFVQAGAGMREHFMVVESAQVINGRLVSSQLSGGELYGMRPTDIFGVMQGDIIRSEFLPMDVRNGLTDDRHVISHTAVPSARGNNMPANILAKIVDSYNTGQQMQNFGVGNQDVYSKCKPYVYEGTIQEMPFFRAISAIRQIPESTCFTFNNLIAFDPNVVSVTNFIQLDARAMMKIHHTGQSEYWHRPDDRQAWVCSVLFNATSTLLMEMMLTKVSFTANNHDTMGTNHVYITGVLDLMNRNNHMNMEAFKHRFIREVMYDLTYGNSITYAIKVTIDLLGESSIEIAYDGQPTCLYVVPSFCDSAFTPVLTTNEHQLRSNAYDISQILQSVHGSVGGVMTMNEGI